MAEEGGGLMTDRLGGEELSPLPLPFASSSTTYRPWRGGGGGHPWRPSLEAVGAVDGGEEAGRSSVPAEMEGRGRRFGLRGLAWVGASLSSALVGLGWGGLIAGMDFWGARRCVTWLFVCLFVLGSILDGRCVTAVLIHYLDG